MAHPCGALPGSLQCAPLKAMNLQAACEAECPHIPGADVWQFYTIFVLYLGKAFFLRQWCNLPSIFVPPRIAAIMLRISWPIKPCHTCHGSRRPLITNSSGTQRVTPS